MAILDRLKDDLKVSMKARDAERTSTLRMLLSELNKAALDAGSDLDEAAEVVVVQRAIKQRRESAEAFTKGDRPELAAKEAREEEILAVYLPQQLSDAELAAAVGELVAEVGATSMRDMGKLMGPLLKRFAGRLDGNRAKAAVQAALGG